MKKDNILKFWNMLPNAFSFTSTITLSMHIEGLNVSYLPIDYHARIGSSSIKPIQDTLRFSHWFSGLLCTLNHYKFSNYGFGDAGSSNLHWNYGQNTYWRSTR